MIDPAILRPGRIDCHIFCDIPNDKERENYFEKKLEILKLDHLKKLINYFVEIS